MTEEPKIIASHKKPEKKGLDEDDLKEIEKDVQNYMKFKVPRNQKTSLKDPLDILIKEPTLIPIEKILKKYEINSKENNTTTEIKQKKYDSGIEINYTLDENHLMNIVSINKNSLNEEVLINLESSLDSNLDLYIKNLYSKMNYSPIIKRIFGKKITFAELEELAILWRFYVEKKIKADEKLMTEFKEKVLKILTNNILDKLINENKYLDDETLSQSSFSVTSHDSVVSAFKRDIREYSFDNNFEKIKPNFSKDFLNKYE